MEEKKKILVIGGSYFYGRVFVMEAAREQNNYDITVLNRGTYSMDEFGVTQITGDRHDLEVFSKCDGDYDAVIDFCAYGEGDVETVIQALDGRVGQYVLISTVDVYERGSGILKTEEHELEHRIFEGDAGTYISGKVALEKEVRRVCEDRGVPYTILRPAILYGPYNYAPRESVYIQMMVVNHVLPRFTDADGRFQFVYVKDAAHAVLRVIGDEKAYGQSYNLCQDEVVTYDSFFETLKAAAKDVSDGEYQNVTAPLMTEELQEIPITVEEAEVQQIPIPFPATAAETELCSNEKSKRELGLKYTDFAEGMRRTFRAFKHVFI
ncbi:MAG: NAD-dependent epimerase/dehydratase family protein [Lachnospiraceae bacterium]|nr:NAD-dependent epimerase/dehydratase family protein [Lachnospiraceae bacterium]